MFLQRSVKILCLVLINNIPFPICWTQTMHSWVGEDMPARPAAASSGPGEGNLEEKCKQVD